MKNSLLLTVGLGSHYYRNKSAELFENRNKYASEFVPGGTNPRAGTNPLLHHDTGTKWNGTLHNFPVIKKKVCNFGLGVLQSKLLGLGRVAVLAYSH